MKNTRRAFLMAAGMLPFIPREIVGGMLRPQDSVIYSGLPEIDQLTGGFKPGELIFLGGRPGMGKTALAMQILVNAVLNQNKRTLLFNAESSLAELNRRTPRELIESRDLFVDNHHSPSPRYISEVASRATKTWSGKYELVIIDYLQLMRADEPAANRTEEMARICVGLKDLAKKLNAPVLVLAQLDRAAMTRLTVNAFRNLPDVLFYADTAMLLHRESYYGRGNKDEAEVLIASRTSTTSRTAYISYDSTLRWYGDPNNG